METKDRILSDGRFFHHKTPGDCTLTNYGSDIFESLRVQAAEVWYAYVQHEFVEKLSDGSLPRTAFLHYLKQDYVFLIHFARAWALAVFKSDRIVEMRTAAAMIDALINEEMRLHIQTCAAEGMDEATLAATREEPENLAYTRFVMDAGIKGDLLDLLVALSPCIFGYGEIGRRLAMETNGPQPDHPYREWIESYASPEYQAVCANVGRLLENVGKRLVGPKPLASPRWPDLLDTFKIASRLEVDFWRMGLRG
uniref:Thiaminase (Transcriptional activator TenA) n=1 Tax=Candidatus Kentrum sp. TUN TaxID=2126343 RepID=A0A451A157_9GAMM|nr:MAG: thiaminase (transcriptional activator TenA) [Candidatus Kentron sp. TUN]